MEAEVIDQASNVAVVKLKGRKFPGILIQGDSLFGLRDLAKELLDEIKKRDGTKSEAYCTAKELFEGLDNRLKYYEKTLKKNSIEPPY